MNESDAGSGKVYLKTFGCQMNEYDSEKMLGVVAPHYSPVGSPDDANLVLINTCSVREKGEHKLFSMLGTLRELKRTNPQLLVGVGGCVAQQEGVAILKRSPVVDFVVGTHNISLIPSLISAVRAGRGPQVAVDYRAEWEELPDPFAPNFAPSSEAPSSGGYEGLQTVRALVAIQRGCNKRCAFCVVPTTRGPEVSRDPREIVREIKLKVRLGAKEVLLLGQTVNSYGRDLTPRHLFSDLIREIAAIEGLRRIRFTSPHPAEVRREFIELYRDIPQLCPHIHLPLQSGSDRVLRLMNRNYRMKRYLEIVDSLREVRPDIALTTDLIVGFPTETESDFEATLSVLRSVRYTSAYCFKYSRRPNTTAAADFGADEDIDDETAHRRLLELQALQEEVSREVNERFRGQTVEVLVESLAPGLSSFEECSSNSPTVIRGRIPESTLIEVRGEATDGGADGTTPPVRVGDIVYAVVERVTPHGLGAVFASGSQLGLSVRELA